MSIAANMQVIKAFFAALAAGDIARMRERLHPDLGWASICDTPACKTMSCIDDFATCLSERSLFSHKLQGVMPGSACRGQRTQSQSS